MPPDVLEENFTVQMMDFPTLETERLILRAVTLDDAAGIFANFSDPDVSQWFLDQPYTQIEQAEAVAREFITKAQTGAGLVWALTLKENGEFIGTCGYEDLDDKQQGEIGFDLAHRHWGRGYMTEALRAIIAYSFTTRNLVKIKVITRTDNARSKKMLEKLGFSIASTDGAWHCYTLPNKREGD